MNVLISALIWASTVGAWVFVLGYGVLAPWWRSDVGRHLWTWGLMVALLLTMIVVTQLLGRDYAGREGVRVAAYSLLTVMIWRHVALLARLQLRRRTRGRHDQTEGGG
ncbi:MAG TPA: hypothetical protein VGL93_10590 [Streptosporangiaceae bacterium]